jgi:L-lactate dehydrogenase (cytochrome)
MPASLLARAACIADLKRRARRRVPRFAFDYLEGGCSDEVALRRNREMLDAIVMEPRYLEDCAAPDLSVTLFGRRYDAPFGVAPVGLGGLIWPRVAEYLAEAAAGANIPFCLSTVATTSIERAAELAGECLWFQLYTPTDLAICDGLLNRAAAAGCRVLLVTIDVPAGGWRPRDLRNGLSVPPRLTLRTLLQGAARPAWAIATLRAGIPRFDSIRPYMPKGIGMAESSAFTRTTFTGGLNREVLARIRDRWRGTLVLKGVEGVRDAELALQLGADGIVVSNHGARQLDAARAPVEVLPQIRAAVGERLTVLADSGVESGTDIARMLATGAVAVLAGRAFVYGVGAFGRAGAAHGIELLRGELAQVMGQLRCARPEELARHLPDAGQREPGERPARPQAVA